MQAELREEMQSNKARRKKSIKVFKVALHCLLTLHGKVQCLSQAVFFLPLKLVYQGHIQNLCFFVQFLFYLFTFLCISSRELSGESK